MLEQDRTLKDRNESTDGSKTVLPLHRCERHPGREERQDRSEVRTAEWVDRTPQTSMTDFTIRPTLWRGGQWGMFGIPSLHTG